jgi:hypothetical protein
MRKFHVVEAGADVTPAAKVRKRLREARVCALPQCSACGGRETIDTRIGAVKQRICVACLIGGRRTVVT